MKKCVKILLIDDDIPNSTYLKELISAKGYDVEYAINGIEGWDKYALFRPDLILMDVNMPEMSGFELAQKIREIDRRTIIFFLTDRTEKTDRLYGFSLKGNDYIPKPFYPEELLARIEERFDNEGEISEEIVIGDTVLNLRLSTLTYNGHMTKLSARQLQILSLLALSKGQLVERKRILKEIWGNDSYENDQSLNVQITQLRKVLPDPRISIVSLKKRGYILTIS